MFAPWGEDSVTPQEWECLEGTLYVDHDGGHGMVFTAPDGRMFLAIHTPNNTPTERPVFLPVRECGDGLQVG